MKEPILVKLKMKRSYKYVLSFIGILIVIISSLGVAYLFYDGVIDKYSDIDVNGSLSINYRNGKKFDVNNQATIEFSVSNSGDKVSYFNIGFINIKGSGLYKLMYDNIVILEGNLDSTDEITTDYISLDIGETKTYTLELTKSSDSNLSGIIDIRTNNAKKLTFADLILKNNEPSNDALSKVGEEAAIENEGLIKSSDDIGVSYYFRGNVDNNYVIVGGLTWRIVRINGDGTVRLVLNDVINTDANYYNTNATDFEYENSYIATALENWSQDNLRNQTNILANAKFCNDIVHDESFNYAAYNRVMVNKIPTLNCLGNSFSSSIGILSVDEVILAGASPFSPNQSYYLYTPNITDSWYTMSAARGNDISINMFMIEPNGSLKTNAVGSVYRKVRPVINLIKNLEMSGKGTADDPYKIAE